MKIFRIFLATIAILLLTAITQIGGLILLLSISTFGFIDKTISKRGTRLVTKVASFLVLYGAFTLGIVPWVAQPLGRVPLPLTERNSLKPANILTCLLNRNYVTPRLRDVAFRVAITMNRKYPGVKVNYLDANFPFMNGFRLFPHLGHNDGKKLDVSLQYLDSRTGLVTNEVPSFIGYGVCEEPKPGEENMPAYCDRMGAWQYSLLQDIVSQREKGRFKFDNQRNRDLVNSFAAFPEVSRMYIEPHLKNRLGLTSAKIRFHGCKAVRHDDHLHIQIE